MELLTNTNISSGDQRFTSVRTADSRRKSLKFTTFIWRSSIPTLQPFWNSTTRDISSSTTQTLPVTSSLLLCKQQQNIFLLFLHFFTSVKQKLNLTLKSSSHSSSQPCIDCIILLQQSKFTYKNGNNFRQICITTCSITYRSVWKNTVIILNNLHFLQL